ncbi:MAG: hypothetical protein IJ198_03070 [Lachnospiraceae bacterium]|nr:hypothetical protein [Lachnospiraceae bacterium]
MTNKEKALALINTFATGDTEKAKELLAAGYIQHNLAYGTGAEAFVGSVAYLAWQSSRALGCHGDHRCKGYLAESERQVLM